MLDLLLFPFGGNSKEAVGVVEAINRLKPTWNLLGFVDDAPQKAGQQYKGLKVLGGRGVIEKYKEAKVLAVPGNPDNYFERKDLIASLGIADERFVRLVHPSAALDSSVDVGKNTLIMAGVVVTAEAAIGSHCVIRPNTVISHDVRIGDYCLVGANVSLSGGVSLGEMCYIGAGAECLQNIVIMEGSLVGMGAVVLKSIDRYTVVAGNPAKLIRSLKG